jgi:PIN domain nuclease of toxin-antitoxin system
VRLLLDTHALIWWTVDLPRLSKAAQNAIADPENTVFVSAVSAFEIALKHGMGKLPVAGPLATAFVAQIEAEGFTGLSITLDHGQRAGALATPHRDPFDRLLIAQALHEELTLVSNERLFDATGVSRLW